MGTSSTSVLRLDPVVKLPEIPGAKLTATSLAIEPGTDKAGWVEIAKRIARVGQGYHWWIADLAAYARHYLDGPEAIQELADATGMAVPSVGYYASMAKSYPVRDRVKGLSFNHHMVVSHLPSVRRHKLLIKARTENLTIEKLKQHITPRSKRTFVVHMRVPNKYRGSDKFFRGLNDLCGQYKATYFVRGTLRKSKLRGERVPLIGVA